MNTQRVHHLWIPQNINIDSLLEQHPDFEQIPGFHTDNLYYILNLLSDIPARNKDLITAEGYVPINATLLRKAIRSYSSYLQYLLNCNVIESDRQYLVGEKSRGYRFTQQYRVGLKKVVVTHDTLIKHLNHKKLFTTGSITLPIQNSCPDTPVVKWHNPTCLRIDAELAYAYNKSNYEHKLADLSKCSWDKADDGTLKDPYLQYIAGIRNIDKISKGQFNLHFDDNVRRLHSSITNIKKELRNAITLNGQEVVAVDISNCQPTLLTILLNKQFWKEDNFPIKISHLTTPNMFNPSIIPNIIMLCKNVQHNRIKEGVKEEEEVYAGGYRGEFEKFRGLVAEGKIYNFLRSEFKKQLGIVYQSDSEVKACVFTVLFTANQFIGQKEAAPKKIFKNTFPGIYKITSLIKRGDATRLPVLLQRIESFLMHQKIIPRIASEKPNLPIIPIHDSIATTKGNEGYVEQVMLEELEKCLGFIPHFKREHWDRSKLQSIITQLSNK